MTPREPASPPSSRSASLPEATPSRRLASSAGPASSAQSAPLSKTAAKPPALPASHAAASYPVVSMCRRDSAVAAAPPPAPDSKPAVSRPVLPSEITIAAGVPLPLSAGRIFKKVAGVGAMALLAGILVVAFTRQPKGVDGGPLSSNVSLTPKSLVTQLSANPTRSVRGKLAPGEGTSAAIAAGAGAETASFGDSADAPHASDTAAVAALAVTTAAGPSSTPPMRTALLTSTTTSKSKLGSSSPMKQAKYVQPARGAGAKTKSKAVVPVKHTTATAKAAPWHGAKAAPWHGAKGQAGASVKAKTSH